MSPERAAAVIRRPEDGLEDAGPGPLEVLGVFYPAAMQAC